MSMSRGNEDRSDVQLGDHSGGSGGPGDAKAWDRSAVAAVLGSRALVKEPLGARTTYRVGGVAEMAVVLEDAASLILVHDALAEAGAPVPVLVLGKGSNMLVSDTGFPGLLLIWGRDWGELSVNECEVVAGPNVSLPVLARRTVSAGLTGLEWAVGVPGSVGGAVVMNAGGHGSDIASVLGRVSVFDLTDGLGREHRADDLGFGYRSSGIEAGQLVTSAVFELERGDFATGESRIAEIVAWRRANQPGGSNAGSVFTNPEGDSAGRLIELAGLKGYRLGTAQVSTKHANFIQADDSGSADDVYRLICHVRRVVADRTGVEIRPEVRLVGFDGSGADTVPAPQETGSAPQETGSAPEETGSAPQETGS